MEYIAEHIKKQALAAKWNQFAETIPTDEPDISDEEIIHEIKAVRAERLGKYLKIILCVPSAALRTGFVVN